VPLPRHIAIIALTRDISTRSLLQVTAALQKQVSRDFEPIWGYSATVDAFSDLHSVPNDYIPVVLFGNIDELAGEVRAAIGDRRGEQLVDLFQRDEIAGIHMNALTRQPFALVRATEAWTVVLSHEVLEMLADPSGNHLIAARHPTRPEQRVKYLIEICDPCMSRWYPVNGVPVADFYTPRYFDPVKVPSIRYSFTGSITEPRQILEGGYLTFLDPRDSGLYQMQYGANEPVRLAGLAELAATGMPLRAMVDNNPLTPQVSMETLRPAASAMAADSPLVGVEEASRGAALSTAEALYSLAMGG
jgi:hypothetical protein